MSTTRTGSAGIGSCAAIAPAKTSAASSSPDSTSGSTPRRRRTPSAKTAALLASRVAEVAQKRTRSGGTPWSRMTSANSSIAAKVRSSASSASTPGPVDALPEAYHAGLAQRHVERAVVAHGCRSGA